MKFVLQVNGRETIFTEDELTSIVKKHCVCTPMEGKWFEVNPLGIDQKLFQEERKDKWQESIRLLILKAFDKLENDPEKYGKIFETMMPNKDWENDTIAGLKKRAQEFGGHNADWVELALEWAQRICNGETWEALCNYADIANWYRLVIGEDGYTRLVGGSCNTRNYHPATYVSSESYCYYCVISNAVPLVVRYK